MLTSQRCKSTLFIAMTVLLISVVGVYALETTDGYNEEVYWDVTVSNLYKSATHTYSYHQFFVENDSDEAVDLTYEFTHRVMRLQPSEEMIVKKKPPEGTTEIVTVPEWGINNDSSAFIEKTHEADIRELPRGRFYIDAYTRINLIGIAEDPVPEVRMNTRDNFFRIN